MFFLILISSPVSQDAKPRTDTQKYSDGWDRIFGKKEEKPQEKSN